MHSYLGVGEYDPIEEYWVKRKWGSYFKSTKSALGKFSAVADYIDNAVSSLRGQKGAVGDYLQQIRCSAKVNKQTNDTKYQVPKTDLNPHFRAL